MAVYDRAIQPLTAVQQEIFDALAVDGPVSVVELRERTGRSRGSVNSALLILQGKGLAERVKWGGGGDGSSKWVRAA